MLFQNWSLFHALWNGLKCFSPLWPTGQWGDTVGESNFSWFLWTLLDSCSTGSFPIHSFPTAQLPLWAPSPEPSFQSVSSVHLLQHEQVPQYTPSIALTPPVFLQCVVVNITQLLYCWVFGFHWGDWSDNPSHTPNSRNVDSYGICTFNFLSNLHTDFHSSRTNLHSHQWCIRVPFAPHLRQDWLTHYLLSFW